MTDQTMETIVIDTAPQSDADPAKTASLYRMVMPDHLCPYGLKAKALLERKGFTVHDHWLTTRDETDRLKRKLDVKATPQVFIAGRRIGGYDDLQEHFGHHVPKADETTYRPVLTLFAVAAVIALAIAWVATGALETAMIFSWFVSVAMVLLGLQKLQDVESFSTMFLNYDLLARRWVPYGYIYPYLETAAGLAMLAGVALWAAAPVALVIGTIGAVSVIKAVWIDGRELKCACMGGGSNTPLGFVSLTENLAMALMGLWMLVRLF
ncbi:glutaredoxin [Frigidibacter sp. MR17.14]|uniref:glutaredoxin n=1 Tax=Frigidibacter sp. MR17.14 TaxID=3126509 RepID=UPI003012D5EA